METEVQMQTPVREMTQGPEYQQRQQKKQRIQHEEMQFDHIHDVFEETILEGPCGVSVACVRLREDLDDETRQRVLGVFEEETDLMEIEYPEVRRDS